MKAEENRKIKDDLKDIHNSITTPQNDDDTEIAL